MAKGASHRQMSVLALRPVRITRVTQAECLVARQPRRFGGGFDSLFAPSALWGQVTMVPVSSPVP